MYRQKIGVQSYWQHWKLEDRLGSITVVHGEDEVCTKFVQHCK